MLFNAKPFKKYEMFTKTMYPSCKNKTQILGRKRKKKEIKERGKKMILKDTISYMVSQSYQNRFIAEYYQLKIRYENLKNMCKRWDAGMLEFKPTCSRDTYHEQLDVMEKYLNILEERAKIENINLSLGIADDEVFTEVEKIIKRYKGEKLNFWNWEDCKTDIKTMVERKFNKPLDLRSAFGREVLNYARSKWEE